jgi:hypothetical protein
MLLVLNVRVQCKFVQERQVYSWDVQDITCHRKNVVKVLNLTPVESLAALSDDDGAETADLMSKHRCPNVVQQWTAMVDGGRKLHVVVTTQIVMVTKSKKANSRSRAMMVQPFHVINVMVKCSLKRSFWSLLCLLKL